VIVTLADLMISVAVFLIVGLDLLILDYLLWRGILIHFNQPLEMKLIESKFCENSSATFLSFVGDCQSVSDVALFQGESSGTEEFVGWHYVKQSSQGEEEPSCNLGSKFHRVLGRCGGSRSGSRFRGQGRSDAMETSECCSTPSVHRIVIRSSMNIITRAEFSGDRSVTEVVFASDCDLKEFSRFCEWTSFCRIDIPSSVEIISSFSFSRCVSLRKVVFASDSHLGEIDRFRECTSLCRIDLPSSAEIISSRGFSNCTSLTEVVVASDGPLKETDGFCECTSLYRITIHASVEIINLQGFSGCTGCPTPL
jgi:hypothetical protein